MTAIWAGHEVPDELWDTIIGGAYGSVAHQQVPPALLLALSWVETKFRNVRSDNRGTPGAPGYDSEGLEKSYSYWQLNQDGVGFGYSAEQLLNPATARFLTCNEIVTIVQQGHTLREAISPWSTAGEAWDLFLANPFVEITGF